MITPCCSIVCLYIESRKYVIISVLTLNREAAKALEAAEKELADARREREQLEEERGEAIDRESAHVFETEQLAQQVDNEYESALRAQELKVTSHGNNMELTEDTRTV